jgi:hypothetical protein
MVVGKAIGPFGSRLRDVVVTASHSYTFPPVASAATDSSAPNAFQAASYSSNGTVHVTGSRHSQVATANVAATARRHAWSWDTI